MRIRTIIAADMRQAMAQIRCELGEDAVIVSSQKAKGGGILVRVAIDEALADERIETAVAEQLGSQAAAVQQQEVTSLAANDFAAAYHDGLIRRLRAPVRQRHAQQKNFNRAELLTILRGHRLPDSLAHGLAEMAEKTRLSDMTLALAAALDLRMRSAPLQLGRLSGILLIGPHGAGKSAMAAKLAAQAWLAEREVMLIAGDSQGAGAVERLRTFAGHLSARFAVAESAAALARLVADCEASQTLAIVDTAGFDPRHDKSRAAFSALVQIGGLEAVGVVSATADAEETAEIAEALTSLGAERLVVTQLDVSRRLGAVAAAVTQGCAICHVTRSPYVAGALEPLTPLSLARALVDAQARAENPE